MVSRFMKRHHRRVPPVEAGHRATGDAAAAMDEDEDGQLSPVRILGRVQRGEQQDGEMDQAVFYGRRLPCARSAFSAAKSSIALSGS